MLKGWNELSWNPLWLYADEHKAKILWKTVEKQSSKNKAIGT
jgi:hypothetical protein